MSASLRPCGLQHTRQASLFLSPKVCPSSWLLSWWCYLTISLSASPISFAFNLSQHQCLLQQVDASHVVAKVLELQLQHQSFQWIFRVEFDFQVILTMSRRKVVLARHSLSQKSGVLILHGFVAVWHSGSGRLSEESGIRNWRHLRYDYLVGTQRCVYLSESIPDRMALRSKRLTVIGWLQRSVLWNKFSLIE